MFSVAGNSSRQRPFLVLRAFSSFFLFSFFLTVEFWKKDGRGCMVKKIMMTIISTV